MMMRSDGLFKGVSAVVRLAVVSVLCVASYTILGLWRSKRAAWRARSSKNLCRDSGTGAWMTRARYCENGGGRREVGAGSWDRWSIRKAVKMSRKWEWKLGL